MQLGLRGTGPGGRHTRRDYFGGALFATLIFVVALVAWGLLSPRCGPGEPMIAFITNVLLFVALGAVVVQAVFVVSMVTGRGNLARLLRLLVDADPHGGPDA